MGTDHTLPTRRVGEDCEWVSIELNDLTKGFEHDVDGSVYPVDRTFKLIEILPSGWVRCVHEKRVNEGEGGDFDSEDVDYYPPQRVNCIFTSESEERVRGNESETPSAEGDS